MFSGTPQNQNLSKPEYLETVQLARSLISSFYFHCLKILVNLNPSIPETGQAFYYIYNSNTILPL